MDKLKLLIKHKLPGRLRLRFSKLPKDMKSVRRQVMEHDGMYSFTYTKMVKSCLITFNQHLVSPHEVMIRTAIAWSSVDGFRGVEIVNRGEESYLTPASILSAGVIGLAFASKFVTPLLAFQSSLNWAAIGSVSLAVLEHANIDIKKKGTVDPEIISLLFLFNSIKKNNFLIPASLAWMLTFGRHLMFKNKESIHLKVVEVNDPTTKSCYYDVEVSKEDEKEGIFEILRILADRLLSSQVGYTNRIFEHSRFVAQSHKDVLEGMGNASGGIILRTKN